MIAKITTLIFVETDDPEHAASMIDNNLEDQMAGFPAGEIIGVAVDGAIEATQEELEEHGLTED